MLIDCDTCQVRGLACGDCVVTVLLGPPRLERDAGVELDGDDRAAIAVLASSGLVPPLRLVPGPEAAGTDPARAGEPSSTNRDERVKRRATG